MVAGPLVFAFGPWSPSSARAGGCGSLPHPALKCRLVCHARHSKPGISRQQYVIRVGQTVQPLECEVPQRIGHGGALRPVDGPEQPDRCSFHRRPPDIQYGPAQVSDCGRDTGADGRGLTSASFDPSTARRRVAARLEQTDRRSSLFTSMAVATFTAIRIDRTPRTRDWKGGKQLWRTMTAAATSRPRSCSPREYMPRWSRRSFGNSDIRTTLGTYAHLMRDQKQEAARKVDTFLTAFDRADR